VKGKWAQGIVPRYFTWIIKDRLAICERLGGYGDNHRKVRRQEEIIWVREQGFTRIVSLLPSPHNLHHYDELGVAYRHLPLGVHDDTIEVLPRIWDDIQGQLANGDKIIVHHDELGDRLLGVMGGYLVYTGLVPEGPRATAMIERLVERQMGPPGRELIAVATRRLAR
jgi:hypothetical protein